jgi:cyclophilin family peptidyl-prolyl cis-trans isomerase
VLISLAGCEDSGPTYDFAIIDTSLGRIELILFDDSAPLAVDNFKGLAARRYFDGTPFHRIEEDFFIQGGDPTGTGSGGDSIWEEPFEDEFDPRLRYDQPGRLGMANAGPDTNRSQFFLTLRSSPHLNDRHTLFGQVVGGMDVVNAIARVGVDPEGRPLVPITVESVRILEAREP